MPDNDPSLPNDGFLTEWEPATGGQPNPGAQVPGTGAVPSPGTQRDPFFADLEKDGSWFQRDEGRDGSGGQPRVGIDDLLNRDADVTPTALAGPPSTALQPVIRRAGGPPPRRQGHRVLIVTVSVASVGALAAAALVLYPRF